MGSSLMLELWDVRFLLRGLFSKHISVFLLFLNIPAGGSRSYWVGSNGA